MIKAAIMHKSGKIEVIEFPKPILEPGSLLVKTLFSEVCGTDVHLQKNQLAGVPYPIIPGHVSTGIIEEINGKVDDVDGITLIVGDKITFLDVHETCNSCWYCLVAKETTRCPKRKVYGITYPAEDGLLGGWSQKIYLKSGVKVIKLPDDLDPKTFIAAGCGLPTALHAVQRASIQLGDNVAVQGSGPVGLMVAILARLSGAFRVILLGAPDLRLKIARKFGIDNTINIDELNEIQRIAKIMQLTNGRGADVTIEATGVPSAVKEGMLMTRDGGTYVIVGQYTNAGDVSINPHLEINRKHLTIKGSWGSDFSHFYLAVAFTSRFHDEFPWNEIISHQYGLSEIDKALDDVANLRVLKAIINPNHE